jgi:hypothetical protein
MGNVMPVERRAHGVDHQRDDMSAEFFERAFGLAELLTRLPESEHRAVVLALLCLLKAGLRGG